MAYYYADLLLEPGGFMLLHDTWMRSTDLVMSVSEKDRPDYTKLPSPLRNLAICQKAGRDHHDGMQFREFYTRRTVISHNLILWMSTGK